MFLWEEDRELYGLVFAVDILPHWQNPKPNEATQWAHGKQWSNGFVWREFGNTGSTKQKHFIYYDDAKRSLKCFQLWICRGWFLISNVAIASNPSYFPAFASRVFLQPFFRCTDIALSLQIQTANEMTFCWNTKKSYEFPMEIKYRTFICCAAFSLPVQGCLCVVLSWWNSWIEAHISSGENVTCKKARSRGKVSTPYFPLKIRFGSLIAENMHNYVNNNHMQFWSWLAHFVRSLALAALIKYRF